MSRKVLRFTVTPMKHGYLLRAEGEAHAAFDGTDIIADGPLDHVFVMLRELILTELPGVPQFPTLPPRPIAVPDPVPGAAK